MWTALLITLPLGVPALGAPVGIESSPAHVYVAPVDERELRLPLRVPVDTIRRVLTSELRRSKRDVLDSFQVVTSKFHDGRLAITGLKVAPGGKVNRLRIEATADLDFARRQLGVKWRGLKSHKKWYDKGRKVVARVRVRGTLEVQPSLGKRLDETSIEFRLTDLRVKITSRIRPVRGLDLRFKLRDRIERWDVSEQCPKGLRGWTLRQLDLTPVVRDGRTTRVDLDVALARLARPSSGGRSDSPGE